MASMLQAPSRRDRLRAATTQEIIETARKLLVEQGPEAISLRAIAREMGMTAPALYRYFGSHEELLRHVVASIFTEIADHVRTAIAAAAETVSPQLSAEEVMAVKMMAGCREFRAWALAHVPEFSMLFGSPVPGLDQVVDDPTVRCGRQFGRVFLDLFTDLYRRRPFSIPADSEIQPSLRGQLERYRESMGSQLPLGALQTFLRCWVLLYGTVSLEAFGHLRFALDDASPMFELMLSDLAPMIGLEYPLRHREAE
ncbi:MAG TPA: TetR/AcrR family transcriptional regulator [Streptosporangiaceae bacterium]|nr:TetR/AcrR family transcriptional regulator [Streptosporangiaceae bacterium]